MKVSARASPNFSIRLTGVSRSAASRAQTSWFSPRAQAASKASKAGDNCIRAGSC